MVIAFCVLRNLCLRQFLWQQLMQGWKIVMHYVAWTSKHHSQDSKGDPKKPIDETWDVCSCHLCGEKSEDLVCFAFSKYSEVQYIVWEREIQIWWNAKCSLSKKWRVEDELREVVKKDYNIPNTLHNPSGFFLFYLDFCPRSNPQTQAFPLEMWTKSWWHIMACRISKMPTQRYFVLIPGKGIN